jgi:hypothetical protein
MAVLAFACRVREASLAAWVRIRIVTQPVFGNYVCISSARFPLNKYISFLRVNKYIF